MTAQWPNRIRSCILCGSVLNVTRPFWEFEMTKLILKRLKCGAKTEQSRSESPWVLTFVGDFGTGNADVKVTRRDNWRLDAAGKCTVDHLLFDQFDLAPSKTLVLSAMIGYTLA